MVIKSAARRNCTGTRRGCNENWEEKHFVIESYRSFFADNKKKTSNSCSKPINTRQDTERQPDGQTGVLARTPYHKFFTLTKRYNHDSQVGIVTWLRAGRSGVRMPKRFFSPTNRPERPWGPYSVGTGALFREVKRPGRDGVKTCRAEYV